MIQAMEAHLASWAQKQIQALSVESDLFGHVRTVAGSLELPPGPPLGQTEVAALVQVQSLTPQAENRDLGPRPPIDGHSVYLTARVVFRLLGRSSPYAAGGDLSFTPAAANFHRVDIAALTLLALLKEQPGPTADGPIIPLVELDQGARPAGAASAAAGARRAHLAWTSWEVGELTLTPEVGQNRQWQVGLTAACQYRLSPAALEGGRILQIGGELSVQNKPFSIRTAAVYGPAELLPLGWFDGLSDGVIAELEDHAITNLGDVGRLGATRMAALASELRTAAPAEEVILGQLANMAAIRQTALELVPLYQLDPVALALPGRALLQPTPEEEEVLTGVITSPEIHTQILMLAAPVVAALRPERREQVALGNLLIRGR